MLKDDKILIVNEKEFTVKCCIWGHDVYQKDWNAKIKSKSKASHETRPDTLAQNKYEMAVKFKHMTVSIKNNIFLSK